MTLNKSFLWGVCVSFFGLLLSFEMLFRITVPTGFWYRHFDFSGDMTSLAELRDRICYAAPPDHRILLLGDSVLGASSLMEHRLPQARTRTLSSLLRRNLASSGTNAISLGSDGLLLPDIEGLTAEFSSHPPERILLLLNFRMFSREFAEGPKALSRDFLLGDLPGEIQKRLLPEKPPPEEARLSDRLYGGMCEHWFLFRETQMFKTLWYYPSQKDFFQRLLERIVGRNEIQTEIAEAALKQKIASYYEAYLWNKQSLPLESLKRVLAEWTGLHISVTVVLTPQNEKFLGSYLDKPSFARNRKILANFMKVYLKSGISFEDWSKRYPSTYFLDHCHLTPEGNAQYAQDLKSLLEKRP